MSERERAGTLKHTGAATRKPKSRCAHGWRRPKPSMNAVVGTFSKASPITAERCVFDICGGNYRLIVAFKFSARVGFINFIGTHAEYDRVSTTTIAEFQEVA